MDLIDRIADLSQRASEQLEHLETEEATKNALVMPLLAALGYDVFNPLEVVPEFTADVGVKKGEKVDYAIKRDGHVAILIECKKVGAPLKLEHASQLFRYFSATDARFAILTNGISYKFYSDIDAPNRMDSKPFFTFELLKFSEHHVDQIKKFSKQAYSLDAILETASTLKYTNAVKRILQEELEEPSEAFVRFFAQQIYDGRITQGVIEEFRGIVKTARNQFINDRINERFKSVLHPESAASEAGPETVDAPAADEDIGDGVETTQDEIDGFLIVRAILREVVDVHRIAMRDTKSYCGILLDDNNRKPIVRLHFNGSKKQLGLFSEKKETRVAIDSVDEIFGFADGIKATLADYGVEIPSAASRSPADINSVQGVGGLPDDPAPRA